MNDFVLSDDLKNYAHVLGMSESYMSNAFQNMLAQMSDREIHALQFASPNTNPPEEQKVLIAFHSNGATMIVWCKGKDVEHDVEQVGPVETSDYIVDTKEAPDHGLHIWEGRVQWTSYTSYSGDGEAEQEYITHRWREPTPDEWAKIIQQENPFDIPLPEEEIRFGNRTTL